VSGESIAKGALYPPVRELRNVARAIAIATATFLRDSGYGRQLSDEQIPQEVDGAMWNPDYAPPMS
jgi:hypothetical protein